MACLAAVCAVRAAAASSVTAEGTYVICASDAALVQAIFQAVRIELPSADVRSSALCSDGEGGVVVAVAPAEETGRVQVSIAWRDESRTAVRTTLAWSGVDRGESRRRIAQWIATEIALARGRGSATGAPAPSAVSPAAQPASASLATSAVPLALVAQAGASAPASTEPASRRAVENEPAPGPSPLAEGRPGTSAAIAAETSRSPAEVHLRAARPVSHGAAPLLVHAGAVVSFAHQAFSGVELAAGLIASRHVDVRAFADLFVSAPANAPGLQIAGIELDRDLIRSRWSRLAFTGGVVGEWQSPPPTAVQELGVFAAGPALGVADSARIYGWLGVFLTARAVFLPAHMGGDLLTPPWAIDVSGGLALDPH